MKLQPTKWLVGIMRQSGAKVGPEEFVLAVNKIYHKLEAPQYDVRHRATFEVVQPIWDGAVPLMSSLGSDSRVRILDYGCGTGFATSMLLRRLPLRPGIEVVCADTCPEMLTQARTSLRDYQKGADISYVQASDPDGVSGLFDLILTNSVLHHLVQPYETVERLIMKLRPGGFYFMGHEPSRRFRSNASCRAFSIKCKGATAEKPNLTVQLRRKALSALAWLGIVTSLDIRRRVSQSLVRDGVIGRNLHPREVSMIVDLHVGNEGSDAGIEGFDISELERLFSSELRLEGFWSYGFGGAVPEREVPANLLAELESLKAQHPRDGASFSALWRMTLRQKSFGHKTCPAKSGQRGKHEEKVPC